MVASFRVHKRADSADDERLHAARSLWRSREPVETSPAALHYLRDVCRYAGPIPQSIAYLPAHDRHAHALIAPFGVADIRGVQLIWLTIDGSGREPFPAVIGHCLGSPIVCTHGSGNVLAITASVEDALTAYTAHGLTTWAAGNAPRMAALADTVPDTVKRITVIPDRGDGDDEWRPHAMKLVERLRARGFDAGLAS